jgi:hypothetical protein
MPHQTELYFSAGAGSAGLSAGSVAPPGIGVVIGGGVLPGVGAGVMLFFAGGVAGSAQPTENVASAAIIMDSNRFFIVQSLQETMPKGGWGEYVLGPSYQQIETQITAFIPC